MRCLVLLGLALALSGFYVVFAEGLETENAEVEQSSFSLKNGIPLEENAPVLQRYAREAKDDKKKKKARRMKKKAKARRNRKRKGKMSKKDKRKNRRREKKKSRNAKKKSKQSRKASKKRKSKRRGKSGKKKSRRNKKAERKERKEKKKSRRRSKNRRNRLKKKTPKSGRQATDVCVKDTATLAGLYGIQVRNLDRIISRAKNALSLTEKKLKKKDVFTTNLNLYESSIGSTVASKAKCGNSQLDTNQTATLSTLQACKQRVEKNCNVTLNATMTALMASCKTHIDTFRTEMASVVGKDATSATICTKTAQIQSGTLPTDLANCLKTLNPVVTDLVTKRGECTGGFGGCRTAERDTISHVYKCKPASCSVGGVTNEADAKKQLATLQNLDGELEKSEAKIKDALKAAGADTGPGADGTLPSRYKFSQVMSSSRLARQTNGCDDVLANLQSFNSSADAAASSATGDFNETAANEAKTSLGNVGSRSTLVDDLKGCTSGSKQLTITVQTRIYYIRFFLFWGGRWRVAVIRVRITFLIVTYNIPTTTTTVTTTSTTTTKTTTLVPGVTSTVSLVPSVTSTASTTLVPSVVSTVSLVPSVTSTSSSVSTKAPGKLIGQRKVRLVGNTLRNNRLFWQS